MSENGMVPKKKVGKLYGGHSFATGPGRDNQMPMGVDKISKGNASKGTFETGPRQNDKSIGTDVKGSMGGGTKKDEAGEDSAGQASGKRSNVKGY